MWLQRLFLCAETVLFLSSATASAGPLSEVSETFPPVQLRAYGSVSGESRALPDKPSSIELTITCETVSKAKLLLAKYLSDLVLLPGTTTQRLKTDRQELSVHEVDGGGVISAIRTGAQVIVLSAANDSDLKVLFQQTILPNEKVDATQAEVSVPMYLDRWDKYGFRFYYAQGFVPPNQPDYDPRQDFTFAEQSGHAGMIAWHSPAMFPTAEGIMNTPSWDWVMEEARVLKLPFGINEGIGGIPWLGNRYPEEMTPNGDQYLGGWYGAMNFGISEDCPAWSSGIAQDVALGQMQNSIRALTSNENVVNWMEPHEELSHADCDLLCDHGPPAQASFWNFLRLKYKAVDVVSQRYAGRSDAYQKWEDVPFPEVATFRGWNSNAVDLTGTWKVSFQAPYGIESASLGLNDSSWPSIQAPGHAIVRYLPRKAAVFRRHFKLDPTWRASHPKVWLYVWDLNDTRPRSDVPPEKTNVLVFLNGQAIPEVPVRQRESHWSGLEVTSALKGDDNVLTVCLPQGMFDYRVYLSGEEPKVYPALGPQMNSRWADYSDWLSWVRGDSVRKGMEMIRQVDPDRPITLAAPYTYLSPLKALAEDYGGVFHDTGSLQPELGFVVQSSGLPTDFEPGSGATNADDFKMFLGCWSTDGIQGVDYFQHIGDVLWRPDVKDYFQKSQNLWHLFGKYHVAPPEVAVMDSDRNERLFGFPWNTAQDHSSSPDLFLASGFWPYQIPNSLINQFSSAEIVEDDFKRGNADKYRVIIDSNTTVMDPDLIDQIEKWVRKGGIFVTFLQTGRHTSVLQDSWPIRRLTGYSVGGIDPLANNGEGVKNRHLHLTEGQSVFHSDVPKWQYVENTAGLSLRKQDPAVQDLLQWDDGSVAAGMRKVGRGMVINLGTGPTASGLLLPQILAWAQIKTVDAVVSDPTFRFRHYVSNNGLFDIWMAWNIKKEPLTVDVNFQNGLRPLQCHDVNTGLSVPITDSPEGAKLSGLVFGSLETRAFITPRPQPVNAPADWFKLQRDWWKGTHNSGVPVPPFKAKLALNLTEDWAFKPLTNPPPSGAPPVDASFYSPTLDDSSWKRMRIGIFGFPDNQDVHHAIFRKRFTVPAEWRHGRVRIFAHMDSLGTSRIAVDGNPIAGPVDEDMGGIFKPGSTHLVAIESWNTGFPAGLTVPVYLSYRPDPIFSQPLADGWAFTGDFLTYDAPKPLPILTAKLGAVKWTVKIDASQSGRNVVIHTLTDNRAQQGVIVNGHLRLRDGNIYSAFDLNVTPWIKFGENNEIIVLTGQTDLKEASIDFYERNSFP